MNAVLVVPAVVFYNLVADRLVERYAPEHIRVAVILMDVIPVGRLYPDTGMIAMTVILFDRIVPAVIYDDPVLVEGEIVVLDGIILSAIYIDTLNIVRAIVELDGVGFSIVYADPVFAPAASVVANSVIVGKTQKDRRRTICDVLIVDIHMGAVGQYYLPLWI